MVEAVSRHGYARHDAARAGQLAGVSKSTFYEHFESKQDCFLSTFDDIIREVGRRIDEAFDRPGDLRERMRAGITTLFTVIAEQQAAASLVDGRLADPGSGRGATPRARRGAFRSACSGAASTNPPPPHRVSALTVRGIVAGVRNTSYHHLREGRGGELPAAAEPIVDWILCFDEPGGRDGAAPRPRPPPRPASRPPGGSRARARFRGPRASGSPARRPASPSRAATRALSIPAIAAAAGVSNQTFYDHFPGKQEAFLAGFERLAAADDGGGRGRGGRRASRGPRRSASGCGRCSSRPAEDELFARLAFFELPMAGPAALDQADRTLGGFTAFFGPQAVPDDAEAPPVILKAITGGTWAVIQHEIAEGRREQLPQLAPEVAEFVLAPFG